MHVHVPRTGGTTLRDALFNQIVQRLSPDQVFLFHLESERYRTGSLDDFKALSKREKRRLRFITGHAPPEVLDHLQRSFSFTTLREPIDRVLSVYWYCFHNKHHPAYEKAHSLSPVDFITGGWGEARDGQTRYLSGHPFHSGPSSDEKLFEAATSTLSRLSYVGFFDQLDVMVSDICSVAKISAPPDLPRTNAAERSSVSTEELSAIAQCNKLDLALYEYAMQHARKNAFGLQPLTGSA